MHVVIYSYLHVMCQFIVLTHYATSQFSYLLLTRYAYSQLFDLTRYACSQFSYLEDMHVPNYSYSHIVQPANFYTYTLCMLYNYLYLHTVLPANYSYLHVMRVANYSHLHIVLPANFHTNSIQTANFRKYSIPIANFRTQAKCKQPIIRKLTTIRLTSSSEGCSYSFWKYTNRCISSSCSGDMGLMPFGGVLVFSESDSCKNSIYIFR